MYVHMWAHFKKRWLFLQLKNKPDPDCKMLVLITRVHSMAQKSNGTHSVNMPRIFYDDIKRVVCVILIY
jgi:hypothetical protein